MSPRFFKTWSKANASKVMDEVKIIEDKELFTDITYYKLQIRKHFVYYIIGLEGQGYRVGGVEEILDQALIISRVSSFWSSTGKKSKIVAGVNLCSSQRHGSAMTNAMNSDFSDMVWDVMQANHWNGAPSIDESCRMVRSQTKAFQLSQ